MFCLKKKKKEKELNIKSGRKDFKNLLDLRKHCQGSQNEKKELAES